MPKETEILTKTCPTCGAEILNPRPVGGIWSGAVTRKEKNGPMYAASCGKCGAELIACPTYQEAESGRFIWEPAEDEETEA